MFLMGGRIFSLVLCLQAARTGLLVRGWWYPSGAVWVHFGAFLAPVRAPPAPRAPPGAFWVHFGDFSCAFVLGRAGLCGAVRVRAGPCGAVRGRVGSFGVMWGRAGPPRGWGAQGGSPFQIDSLPIFNNFA